ncbi:UvrD-helicase domain-containing protein [Paenibacillus sp. NPDC093718]|uniref:UvrD-helicase domain-containing protein n=1 Tax=Paenibacillus sp. NPDC093718 TaxID=3390601 RepID=UPI003D037D40
MVSITLEEIREIEPLLLNAGKSFNDDQINVIISNHHSYDVIACPGSGKTTVLIAKLALIIRKMEKANKGICIITHTNVGVEEILKQLKNVGINELSHPHFIGTIHDFLNTFFAIKAYKLFFNHNRLTFLDDDDYQKYYLRNFERNKPNWWTYNPPSLKRLQLVLNDDGSIGLLNSNGSQSQSIALKSISDLMQVGIMRHSDTLSLSYWYIQKYKAELNKAFQNRFMYLFMDETQDTSIKQYDLLNLLFNETLNDSNTIIQRFGDPYQALYNSFNEEGDAWVPDEENSIQISFSNRFGPSIANVLKTTCIRRYDVLVGNPDISSFKPHLLIYNDSNKDQLLSGFCVIVKNLEGINKAFRESTKKISAVCRNHEALGEYHSSYIKKQNDQKKVSFVQKYHKMLINILIRLLRSSEIKSKDNSYFNNNTLIQLLKESYPKELMELKIKISEWIKRINLAADKDYTELNKDIKDTYQYLLKTIWQLNITEEMIDVEIHGLNQSFKDCNDVITKHGSVDSEDNNVFLHNEVSISLDTIHAVKGETHKATLLLESNLYMDQNSSENESDLSLIFNYFVGDYDVIKVNEGNIKMYLKLAYVALSRPNYLAAVAINEKNLLRLDEKINVAKENNWNVINLNDIIERYTVGTEPKAPAMN